MNVLSLFDGMSGGQIALERAGISVRKYYAAELDKYAITVTQANYPNTIQLGDVTKWREWDIDWASIGLLLGGSPCQGFSFAGKQLAFDDPRSKLFFVYVDILNHIRSVNPNVKFMLENVKMKKEYLDVISEHLGVDPVFINSALVSAQNRQRYYWANWEFGLPEDKGIVLADVIESGFADRDKSLTVTTRVAGATAKRYLEKSMHQMIVDKPVRTGIVNKGGNLKSYFEKHRRQLVFELSKINPQCIDVSINENGVRPHRGDKRKSGISELGRMVFTDGKKRYALTTSHMPKLIDELGFRKLTPVECERLQTVPDNYTNHVSNTQRYKMLGNGWTVDVVAHIFNSI